MVEKQSGIRLQYLFLSDWLDAYAKIHSATSQVLWNSRYRHNAMREIRHTCQARLFDSRYRVHLTNGNAPDIELKCTRCSRKTRGRVTAGYTFALPHYITPSSPSAIFCSDENCMARLCDLSLPYTIVGREEDVAIACARCKKITRLRLSGVAEVRSI